MSSLPFLWYVCYKPNRSPVYPVNKQLKVNFKFKFWFIVQIYGRLLYTINLLNHSYKIGVIPL